jgi:hypothetical protein
MGFTSSRGRSIPPESVDSAADLDAWADDMADAYGDLPDAADAAGTHDAERFRALGLPDGPPF